MGIVIKRTKEKSLTIRLNDETYRFIAKKAAEKKITKSTYLLSQLDKDSDLAKFLIEDEKNQEILKKEIISQIKEIRKSIKKSVTSTKQEIVKDLNSVRKEEMKLSEFKYIYSNYINDPDFKNWITAKAKKLGVNIE